MIKIVVALLSVPVVLWALSLFPWPEIDFILNPIIQAVGFFYSFNMAFPVTEMMTIFGIIMGIEGAMLAYRVIAKVLSFITGHRAPTDDAKI